MSLAIQLVIAIAIAVAGFAGGVRWHAGEDAIEAKAADQARQADAKQQQHFNDQRAGQHADALETLNTQLGDARVEIAHLSGRACLPARTVRVLNATGVVDVPAAAGNPAGAASAPAAATDDGRFSTDGDVAGYIALCRTDYARVSDQLNQILDIEDRRHPPAAASP